MKTKLLAVALAVGLVASGCSFASGMDQLQKYLPVAIQAFEGILSILVQTGALKTGQATSLDAGAAEVSADFGDLQAAVNAYNLAPGADKSSPLAKKVVTALDAVQSSLAAFLADAHIKNSTAQATVSAAVLLISTTLASIEATISPNPTPAQVHARVAAKKLNAGSFKKQFNVIVTNGGFPEHQLQ